MSGKGSSPRPYSVDQKTFDQNWDRIFKKERSELEQQKNHELNSKGDNANETKRQR